MSGRGWQGFAWLARTSLVVEIALVAGCGGDDSAAPVDPPSDPCVPHLAANWTPRWKPPVPPRDACTPSQIDREYAFCESPSSASATCSSFRNDASNSSCVACLFSDDGDASYGPIIRSADNWRSNTAGCIALLEGDVVGTGCGAKVQASSSCYDTACSGCMPLDAYVKCRQAAAQTQCRSYYLDAVCVLRPEYAACTEYVTSQEYFVSAAKAFCSPNGVPANARREDGTP